MNLTAHDSEGHRIELYQTPTSVTYHCLGYNTIDENLT